MNEIDFNSLQVENDLKGFFAFCLSSKVDELKICMKAMCEK